MAASTAPNMSRGEFLDRPIDARNGGKAVIPSSFVVCHNTRLPDLDRRRSESGPGSPVLEGRLAACHRGTVGIRDLVGRLNDWLRSKYRMVTETNRTNTKNALFLAGSASVSSQQHQSMQR